jgi:glycosyltransferase involved in cell wall biosynthesis
MNKNNLKVALVHDFLVDFGGAERVFEVLCEMFPEAPIYTLLYDKDKMSARFGGRDIRTSFLQKFPRFLRRRKKWLLPFLPVAPETFDLRDFDLVISSSGAWSKGIVTRLNTIHISYLHSPMRFAWDYNSAKYLKENKKGILGFCVHPFLNYLRLWDYQAADRPDFLIANSEYTRKRIAKYYRREAEVIYPPVQPLLPSGEGARRADEGSQDEEEISDNSKNSPQNNEPPSVSLRHLPPKGGEENSSYFLIVSRLSPYKRTDLAVRAFNELGLPLVVIGEGSQKKYLQKIAKENIKILGWKDDADVAKYYQNARAFVFPVVDDFGIAIIEAMSVGVPVIAYRRGGALEIVKEGENGEFFDAQSAESLIFCVKKFVEKEDGYNREMIAKSVERFSKERFMKEFDEYLNKIYVYRK